MRTLFCQPHFHIALETPEANLMRGMQWLASTFGNRFNRLVRQRGHVFQGRYKALLVEGNDYLLQLVNYILWFLFFLCSMLFSSYSCLHARLWGRLSRAKAQRSPRSSGRGYLLLGALAS